MAKYNLQNRDTLNLIELSDVFRRSATKFDNKDAAERLNKLTREIGCLSTHYYCEAPNIPENKRIDKKIKNALEVITRTALKLKIKTVTLPLEKHKDNFPAVRIEAIIKELGETPVTLELHTGNYQQDNSRFGKVTEKQTILDEGVRGVTAFTPFIPH